MPSLVTNLERQGPRAGRDVNYTRPDGIRNRHRQVSGHSGLRTLAKRLREAASLPDDFGFWHFSDVAPNAALVRKGRQSGRTCTIWSSWLIEPDAHPRAHAKRLVEPRRGFITTDISSADKLTVPIMAVDGYHERSSDALAPRLGARSVAAAAGQGRQRQDQPQGRAGKLSAFSLICHTS